LPSLHTSTIEVLRPPVEFALGTALTVALLCDAVDRGCCTATLQSTPMAERVYASVGFRDLGLMFEYAPPHPAATSG